MADDCILIVELKKLAFLKEQYLVIVFPLHSPVLLHEW